MKHIKNFNNYEMLNEKISWNTILFMFFAGLGVGNIHNNIKNYTKIKSLYNEVNSEKSVPKGEDKERVEEIRKQLISTINSSNFFKKSNKEWIVDSIKTINFKIVSDMSDMNYIANNSISGCYINLESIQKNYYFTNKIIPNKPSVNNIIIIDRKILDDEDCVEIIEHELYHYLDFLSGDKSKDNDYFSDNIDFKEFIDDKVIDDRNHALYKYTAIHCRSTSSMSKSKRDNLSKLIFNASKEDYKYITSSTELFSRFKTFKSKLAKEGYIQDINQVLNKDIVVEYITDKSGDISYDDLNLLLYLKFDKIDELDRLLN